MLPALHEKRELEKGKLRELEKERRKRKKGKDREKGLLLCPTRIEIKEKN